MPVNDLNGEKMGNEMLNFFEGAETTTDLWILNTDTLAWIFLFLIVISLIIGLLVFFNTLLGRMLKR